MNLDLSPKEQVIELLGNLPDDVSFEEVQYSIFLLDKLNESERDSREGRVYTHDEFVERLNEWLATLEPGTT